MTSLCFLCRYKREVVTGRGSQFLLCRKSLEDERFAKYPPQPIVRCSGFESSRPGQGMTGTLETEK
jgi:hypothetical protein